METVVLKRVSEDEMETFGKEVSTNLTIKQSILSLMEVDGEYLEEWYENINEFILGELDENLLLIIKNDGTIINLSTSIEKENFNFDQTIKKYLEGNDLDLVTKITVKEVFSETTIEREYEDGDRLIEVLFNWLDIEGGEFELYYDNDIKKLVRNRVIEEGDTFYLIGVEGELELELDKLEYKDFNRTLKELYWENM